MKRIYLVVLIIQIFFCHTRAFTPLAADCYIATSGTSLDLTSTNGDDIVCGDPSSSTDITAYDLANFGNKILIDDNGKLIFGGQEIKGTAVEASNEPGTSLPQCRSLKMVNLILSQK